MTEYFRRIVLRYFAGKKLLTEQFARNLLSWRHSGFSIDNSVRILDERSRENLAQYLARPPVSLKKIHYEGFKGRVLFHTRYNEYFKENVHMPDACPGRSRRLRPGFNACDFLAELTPGCMGEQMVLAMSRKICSGHLLNELYRCYSGTGGNKTHFTASRKTGATAASGFCVAKYQRYPI